MRVIFVIVVLAVLGFFGYRYVNQPPAPTTAGQQAGQAAQTAGTAANQAGQAAGKALESAGQTVQGAAQQAQEAAKSAGQQLQEGAASVTQQAQEAAKSAGDALQGAGHQAGDAADSAQQQAGDAVDSAQKQASEAAGSAQQQTGEAADSAQQQAGDAASGAQETVSEAGRYVVGGVDVSAVLDRATFNVRSALESVTNSDTANVAKARLEAIQADLDGVGDRVGQLPESARTTFASTVAGSLPTIEAAGERVKGMQDVGPQLAPTVDAILGKMREWAKAPA